MAELPGFDYSKECVEFTSQFSLVLIAPDHGGMAKLS